MESFPAVPGVRALEHTGDLALEVKAASLPQLFERATRGMLALIEQGDLEADAAAPAPEVAEPLRQPVVAEPHPIPPDDAEVKELLPDRAVDVEEGAEGDERLDLETGEQGHRDLERVSEQDAAGDVERQYRRRSRCGARHVGSTFRVQ
jgi:hypothetical protein